MCIRDRRKIDGSILDWYSHYLLNRLCNMGGVLSVILWLLIFDELLNKFGKQKRIKIIGFADDGSLLISGRNLQQMYKLMQKAIDMAHSWAKSCGLRLSPEKTVSILFSRKHVIPKDEELPKLRLEGRVLERVYETKYLGITLDHKLTWTPPVSYTHLTLPTIYSV